MTGKKFRNPKIAIEVGLDSIFYIVLLGNVRNKWLLDHQLLLYRRMSSLFLHLLGLGQQKAQYPSQEAITQPFHLYFHHTLGLQRPSYFYLEDYFPNIPRLSPFRLYFQLAFIWGLIRSFPSSKKHLLIRQARQARWQGKEVDTKKELLVYISKLYLKANQKFFFF